jgi:hypothetical protein
MNSARRTRVCSLHPRFSAEQRHCLSEGPWPNSKPTGDTSDTSGIAALDGGE